MPSTEMLAANQGQNSSRGLPRCSATLIELMPFCSTSSALGAAAGRSTGVSPVVIATPFQGTCCSPSGRTDGQFGVLVCETVQHRCGGIAEVPGKEREQQVAGDAPHPLRFDLGGLDCRLDD